MARPARHAATAACHAAVAAGLAAEAAGRAAEAVCRAAVTARCAEDATAGKFSMVRKVLPEGGNFVIHAVMHHGA